MTDLEKEELRTAKGEVTARLERISVARYGLPTVDERLEIYVGGVIDNPEQHNLWEQLSVELFFAR